MLYRSKMFQIGARAGVLSIATFLSIVSVPAAASPTNSSPTLPPLILSGKQTARPAGTFSAGVPEIVKMLDAKVETEVLLAYIQTSPVPYNPDATDLVALKSHGASTEILTAMLHHGDELRLRLAQSITPANPAPAGPAYDYPPEATPPAYSSAPYPEAGVVPYGPVYYGYGYRSPVFRRASNWTGCHPWYDYGHWWAPFYDCHHSANENPATWDTAVSRVTQAPFLPSALPSGHTTALVRRSDVAHTSGGGHTSAGGHTLSAKPAARLVSKSR
jgi:hypothetical protein